jgi:RNA polymerase sigma-70 factor (ECF subfamily)
MAHGEELADADLARRAAAGCVESFALLASRYQVRIIHYVRQLLGPSGSGDADDIAQEAFVRAWRSIATFDDQWAFSTWLFTIVRRTCLNYARGTRRRRIRETVVAPAEATAFDPCRVAVAVERTTRLWDVAAAALPERQFTAVWLRYVEGKSVSEIATVLVTSETTVKMILFRARRRLAPLLRDLVD